MLVRARERLGDRRGFRFARLDGQAPDVGSARFDLICANLAVQWFDDLPGALARLRGLLAPGGALALTTLVEGSFTEWRQAHRVNGFDAATHAYPSLDALRAMLPGGSVEPVTLTERHATAADFLRALKGIGAGVPRAGHRPLPPADLRRVMRSFEAAGALARYEIAIGIAGPCA
jgi:malonyl-CoA O-methyltransferase